MMRTLNPRQAADELDVHERTLRNWCRNDGAPCDRTPGGDYRLDPGEILAWMKATGRSGKPGRPDATEKNLREQVVGLPRAVVAIDPGTLRACLPNYSAALNLLTLPQAERACGVWAEAWEMYLLHSQGNAGESAPSMPLSYWRGEFHKLTESAMGKLMGFVEWSLLQYLRGALGAERMVGAMPSDFRQEVREWLKGSGKVVRL